MTAVANLQTDADFDAWRIDWPALQAAYVEQEILVERCPIRDFDGDDLVTLAGTAVECPDRLLQVGHRDYLHCTAGQQRSPAVAIAWLVVKRGRSLADAVGEVSARRVCAPDLAALETLFGQSPHPPPPERETDR